MTDILVQNLSVLQIHAIYFISLGLFCYLSVEYPLIMKICFPFIVGYMLLTIPSNDNLQVPFLSSLIFDCAKGLFVFIPAIMYIYHREIFSFIPLSFYSIILTINIVLVPLFISFNEIRTLSTMWNGILLLLIAWTVPSSVLKHDFVSLKTGNMLWILCYTLCLLFTHLYNKSFDIQNDGNGRYSFVYALIIPLLFSVIKESWWIPVRAISLIIVFFLDVNPSIHNKMMEIETKIPLKSVNEYIEPIFLLVNTFFIACLLYKNRSRLDIIGL